LDRVQWMYSIVKYFPPAVPPNNVICVIARPNNPFDAMENYQVDATALRTAQIAGLPDFFKLHLREYRWPSSSTYNDPSLVDKATFRRALNDYKEIPMKAARPKSDDPPKEKVKITNFKTNDHTTAQNSMSTRSCAICKAAGIPTWKTHDTSQCRNINQLVKPRETSSSSVARSNDSQMLRRLIQKEVRATIKQSSKRKTTDKSDDESKEFLKQEKKRAGRRCRRQNRKEKDRKHQMYGSTDDEDDKIPPYSMKRSDNWDSEWSTDSRD
jgi:hypothetical protein